MAKRIVLNKQPWNAMIEQHGLDAKRRTCGQCRHRFILQFGVHRCSESGEWCLATGRSTRRRARYFRRRGGDNGRDLTRGRKCGRMRASSGKNFGNGKDFFFSVSYAQPHSVTSKEPSLGSGASALTSVLASSSRNNQSLRMALCV